VTEPRTARTSAPPAPPASTSASDALATRPVGMYDPRFERDACGIGFVAHVDGRARRQIVEMGLEGLCGVEHRGAVAADAKSGDGAGVLTAIPTEFFAAEAGRLGAEQADPDRLGVAFLFLDDEPGEDGDAARATAREQVVVACRAEGLEFLAWRDVPVDEQAIGRIAAASMPALVQALFQHPEGWSAEEAERAAFRARRRARLGSRAEGVRYYAASWSFRTVTYKALSSGLDLGPFYRDLQDDRFVSPFVIFHSRYSTNTAPTWERAQPYRMICHNGEINTIEGNVNLMRAREAHLGADWVDQDVLRPVIESDQSDSARLDNALELLHRGGRDVRHGLAMLVPAAWEGHRSTDPAVRDFYRYHSTLMEPWDGPAGLIFTDGRRVGAALDRNGLRPLRYLVCEDGLVVAASEVGAVRVEGRGSVRRERLGPGQMVCVDPEEGLQEDVEIKALLAEAEPYGDWLRAEIRPTSSGRPVEVVAPDVERRQRAFGYTKEELTSVLRPMATEGKEPTSSMGDDTPIPPVAQWHRPVSHYLKQRFAQVTNPPIDHLRESEVMSLRTLLGPRQPLLTSGPEAARLIELETFILYPDGLRDLVIDPEIPFSVQAVDATFAVAEGPAGLEPALRRIGDEAVELVHSGAGILVVSDTGVEPERCRIPIVLAVGAVHQRLLSEGLRTRTSLVAETDEARMTHDMAVLLGYGADAIVPRLVLETFAHLADEGLIRGDDLSGLDAQERLRTALEDGVLKIMSKMGISTVDSYRSAQIFEAVGLAHEVVELCLTGTVSRLGGLTFTDLAEDALEHHRAAFAAGETEDEGEKVELPSPSVIKFSRRGVEYHDMNPDMVGALHDALGLGKRTETEPFTWEGHLELHTAEERAAHLLNKAVEEGRADLYERFADIVHSRPTLAPRDLLAFVESDEPVPLDEVESAASIVRRFSTGAMSHGALSSEAHETLAIALNMIGGAANSGEGGEDPRRYRTRGTARDANCSIKQVASGRFGVTPEYLAFADELQIKMAQGSKPGEGGQIPGHKVSEEIARLRHTTPGVTLISPPPHHDIYSIEDLAQLIYDLKQANPEADVSVKLVAETGVGQIAAGVVKGLADVVHIAGHDGGTGASALSSILHAGMPWEIGLAETQQTLRLNGLRDRVRVRADGGFRTGRDVLLAALLGADEFSFGTAALLAEGCILVRTCHRNTCPVGIATQRRDLRDRFEGRPEQVAAYLLFVAEEVRRGLAAIGLRSVEEAVGRVDLLTPRQVTGRDARLDVSPLLVDVGIEPRRFSGRLPMQRPRSPLGDQVFEDALETVFLGGLVEYKYAIRNQDRTIGARLGSAVGLEFGQREPHGTARLRVAGEAGQSFGAFLSDGVELVLDGEANDYVGKGMGGGRIVVRPAADDAGDPVLVGNTVLYGATGGELFVAGRAGERFAVRNSGATAVVEGTGDHACEYMTNGTVVVLGPVGSNVGAGMSGGQAFIYDPTATVLAKVNRQLVEARRPDGFELDEVRELVERHATVTGSTRAAELLGRWDDVAERIWRIGPKTELEKVAATDSGGARTTT
jgi:glutamate synthase domain-containing protein 2/glutamate synthase domain-containing protein 1/glutamate synthase domain-containing protein 3